MHGLILKIILIVLTHGVCVVVVVVCCVVVACDVVDDRSFGSRSFLLQVSLSFPFSLFFFFFPLIRSPLWLEHNKIYYSIVG